MSYRFKRRLITILFTLGAVALVGLCTAPLPIWGPQPTPTPEPTPTPQPHVTVCGSGCDFTALQAAVDAGSVAAG